MAQTAVYLVTLSHAERVPAVRGKADFGERVEASFCHAYGDVVSYWCASEEAHKEGGFHYHLAIKLTRSFRPEASRAEVQEPKKSVLCRK